MWFSVDLLLQLHNKRWSDRQEHFKIKRKHLARFLYFFRIQWNDNDSRFCHFLWKTNTTLCHIRKLRRLCLLQVGLSTRVHVYLPLAGVSYLISQSHWARGLGSSKDKLTFNENIIGIPHHELLTNCFVDPYRQIFHYLFLIYNTTPTISIRDFFWTWKILAIKHKTQLQ
jgi:hypothetical protein